MSRFPNLKPKSGSPAVGDSPELDHKVPIDDEGLGPKGCNRLVNMHNDLASVNITAPTDALITDACGRAAALIFLPDLGGSLQELGQ